MIGFSGGARAPSSPQADNFADGKGPVHRRAFALIGRSLKARGVPALLSAAVTGAVGRALTLRIVRRIAGPAVLSALLLLAAALLLLLLLVRRVVALAAGVGSALGVVCKVAAALLFVCHGIVLSGPPRQSTWWRCKGFRPTQRVPPAAGFSAPRA
ncbi:MAG: hypothetical protein M5U33_06185 [Pseudorhodoplanes sp.]|nr:hypothetical protein [Pseudorhodoplanes sp.]